jgi:outer membrane lipoprotein SlyB
MMQARPFLFLLPLLTLATCGPSYSPDTYASSAVQQAARVDQGVVAGVREVAVTPQGTTGAVAGAAAGGAVGAHVPAGSSVTSTLGAIGGSLIGGLVGSGAEKAMGETRAWEYIVRKTSGELVSVTQRDTSALAVGTRVLVISGSQARIVPDYTVPPEPAAPPPVASPPVASPPVAPPAVAPAAEAPPSAAPADEVSTPVAAGAPEGDAEPRRNTPPPE